MAKVHILDRAIHTWTPTEKGRPCIAMIDGLTMIFKGKTPMQAHMAADRWRKQEIDKLVKKDATARRLLEERNAALKAAQ